MIQDGDLEGELIDLQVVASSLRYIFLGQECQGSKRPVA